MQMFIVVLTLVALSGCTSSRGFDRGALQEDVRRFESLVPGQAKKQPDSPQVTDDDIKRALELKPQITFPIKVGVYLNESWRYGVGKWRWSGEDKGAILAWGSKLKNSGIVSEMLVISNATVTTADTKPFPDVKAIRLAAAQHGADAVLVVKGVADVDRYNNPLAVLYLTLIGAFILPGTHVDALFMMNGALFDVRNEYLYLTAEAESLEKSLGPGATIQDKEVIEAAKKKALEHFGEEYINRMISISRR
jgi:hypothetical protein